MDVAFSGIRGFDGKGSLTSNGTIRFLRLPPLPLFVKNIQEFALRERDFVRVISGTGVCAGVSAKDP